jgi:beta-lactamase class A
LTEEQRRLLHEVSLKFIARDELEAQKVATGIDYMEGSSMEHPSLMCGPLSIAILRDSGLLAVGADVSDFWLPDPKGPDTNLFLQTFPEKFYEWISEKESIRKINFTQKPLYPGDLLFLRAGNRGSYGHVLVVTRIDDEGRVFSVTNFRTPNGFVVDEVMLYDPEKPGEGKFYEWTDAKNSNLGLTGFGGFYLWRLKDTSSLLPAERYDSLYPNLKEEIDTLLAQSKGKWRILIQDISGRTIYAKRPDKILHPASVIKIPIALDFFSLMENKGLSLEETLSSGTKERSFDQLLRAMIINSEEEATRTLRHYLQVQPNHSIEQTLQNWGAWHTTTSPRRSTASDTALLLRGLYQGRFLGVEVRKKLLGYMKEYTSPDDTRVGILKSQLPFGYNIYNKRGTITSGMLVVADAAIVEIPGNVLTMVFYGYWGEEGATYKKLVTVIEKASLRIYKHIQKASDLEKRPYQMK